MSLYEFRTKERRVPAKKERCCRMTWTCVRDRWRLDEDEDEDEEEHENEVEGEGECECECEKEEEDPEAKVAKVANEVVLWLSWSVSIR